MRDFVVSCSSGYYDKTPILDLNFYEDASGSPDMSVAILPKSGTITLLQMDSKMNVDTFEEVCNNVMKDHMKLFQVPIKFFEKYIIPTQI
jgi:exosome complex component RRP41